MNRYTIIPSDQAFKLAPSVDQEINVDLEQKTKQITEFERTNTVDLAQVYDNERQACSIFRPTFKVNFIYSNSYAGTTKYLPFLNNLYYVDPEVSIFNGIWRGYPQYYEFDFYRPRLENENFSYKPQSAFTYNWTYYFSYASENDYNKMLFYTLNNTSLTWKASEGIPFTITNSTLNGNDIIFFKCAASHGLTVGESVELSINYNNSNIFQVFSLGDGNLGSDEFIFTIYNLGYTGTTFSDGVTGTFKRVINPDNLTETRSKYYIRKNKVLTNLNDIIITKVGFEKNPFIEEKKLELACISPNNKTRIAQKTSNNTYTITSKRNLVLDKILDNQKRPVSEIYLTIINKGYSGYFNNPTSGSGLKQGWEFNITEAPNAWWADVNANSNTNITTNSYTKTSGITATFFFNNDLKMGDLIDGDFCEWNDYEQTERVVSPYYHKIKFNQNVFTTENIPTGNAGGYYYKPHKAMKIRSFSSYVETGNPDTIDLMPNYSFYSESDAEFRWRDLYTYGFIDEKNIGVDYPYLNNAHYPFEDFNFKLIPEGSNYNNNGINLPIKPVIDACE